MRESNCLLPVASGIFRASDGRTFKGLVWTNLWSQDELAAPADVVGKATCDKKQPRQRNCPLLLHKFIKVHLTSVEFKSPFLLLQTSGWKMKSSHLFSLNSRTVPNARSVDGSFRWCWYHKSASMNTNHNTLKSRYSSHLGGIKTRFKQDTKISLACTMCRYLRTHKKRARKTNSDLKQSGCR